MFLRNAYYIVCTNKILKNEFDNKEFIVKQQHTLAY